MRSLNAVARLARSLTVAVPAMLAACDVVGPTAPLPDDAVAFAAPAQFKAWWALTESCAGRRSNLEAITWFIVPGVSTFMTPQGAKVGRWSRGSSGTQIVVAGRYIADEMVIRHEMLHSLIDQGGHPPKYFVARCHLTWQTWGMPAAELSVTSSTPNER